MSRIDITDIALACGHFNLLADLMTTDSVSDMCVRARVCLRQRVYRSRAFTSCMYLDVVVRLYLDVVVRLYLAVELIVLTR